VSAPPFNPTGPTPSSRSKFHTSSVWCVGSVLPGLVKGLAPPPPPSSLRRRHAPPPPSTQYHCDPQCFWRSPSWVQGRVSKGVEAAYWATGSSKKMTWWVRRPCSGQECLSEDRVVGIGADAGANAFKSNSTLGDPTRQPPPHHRRSLGRTSAARSCKQQQQENQHRR
jgi:hypothetical protein